MIKLGASKGGRVELGARTMGVLARIPLDGFDPRGNIKVLMATNRPDTLGKLQETGHLALI